MNTHKVSALLACLIASSATLAQTPPPQAPVRPITDDYFGTKVVDNYRWMENLKDPEMQRWMKAQADYTRATFDSMPGRPALEKRAAQLAMSQPAIVGGLQVISGRYYSLRTPAGVQSAKLYVREGVKGADRLLIDPEKLSTDPKSHLSIHDYRPSPDGRYIAYQLAAGGSEETVLHILDVQAGKDLPETADRADGGPHWRADSKSFFYSRQQKLESGMPKTAKYQNERAYLHTMGHSFDEDPPILGRGVSDTAFAMTPDEFPEIVTSPNSHYAIAMVSPGTDPRLRVYAAPVDAIHDGKTAWRPIAASYDDQYIAGDSSANPVIALAGDTLYWPSRKDAPRGEILKLDLSHADSKPEVVVRQGALPISAVYAGRDAIYWRVNDAGINGVQRLGYAAGAKPQAVQLPYASNIDSIVTDAGSSAVVLHAASWLRTDAYLGVDPESNAVTDTGLRPRGPDDLKSDLVAEEVKVKSWDGTLVPLSIVHKKGLLLADSAATLLDGYGAYGINDSPLYLPMFRAFYERGGIIASAHVRGGGELGEAWHLGGYKATKPNTWKDFIACAQYLIAHGYTTPRKLVGRGGSAGGITIGRAIEERPDLFAAARAVVPAADMLRFETTANGAGNVPEFGSVKTKAGFKALYAMSAYAHVKDGVKYPAVLVTTGINDPRVDAWIPAKFAARLQAATASGKPVLLRVDYDAGHGFDSTRHQQLEEFVDAYAFVLWQTGDPAFQPK
ncbi:MAG: prolyl oligopeptidase family serine peptidase [Rhodanobacteraceae bacterium]